MQKRNIAFLLLNFRSFCLQFYFIFLSESKNSFFSKKSFFLHLQKFSELNKNRFLVILGLAFSTILAGFLLRSSGSEDTSYSKNNPSKKKNFSVQVDEYELTDSTRNRKVPFAVFLPKNDTNSKISLVIFSHGYGQNYSKNYLNYSYLTRRLAQKGFWVLSIQHELAGDPPLPMKGNMQEIRMPVWKKGEANILFALHQFKNLYPKLKLKSVDLIGHSNGGDMSLITAHDFPKQFRNVITLDHLRYPIPLVASPHIASLRSVDKTADAGVIPNKNERDSLNIKIIQLRKITHNQMNDEASKKQKNQINTIILRLLRT